MATSRESKIRSRIVRNLKTTFPGVWLVIHGHPQQSRGISDIIGLHKGKFYAFEVKQPHKEKTLTKIQSHFLIQVNKHGGCGKVVTSWEEAKHWVKRNLS